MSDNSWKKIFEDYKIIEHNFDNEPYILTASQIKLACQNFKKTGEKEVRILCKQDTRNSRPQIFKDLGLFLLPIKNGTYAIIKGEGYIDIPEITCKEEEYFSKLDFNLDSSVVGNSEMQHLDYAYASSLIRTFMNDSSLVLTIRGRKFTPQFVFNVEKNKIVVESVQTEVDAGYEGKDKIVLIEAKNNNSSDTIIRQLFYPYRQWKSYTKKSVHTLFFQKYRNYFYIWEFCFENEEDYNSIKLVKTGKYKIVEENHGEI